GERVRAVCIMHSEGRFNALAAAWDISNRVLTVTRCALETLSRDELQGVIAHEFSHIVNGDMRLNIRMIGVLAGILFIGSIGQFLMRSSRDPDNKGSMQIYVVGLALFIVGYVGLFFARLIKAAVSAGAAAFAGVHSSGRREGDIGVAWGRSSADSVNLVGALEPAKMDYAARLLKALPEPLRVSLREPDGARAAIIALLLAPKEEVMLAQLEALKSASLTALAERAATAAVYTRNLGPAYHLPVVDRALPAI